LLPFKGKKFFVVLERLRIQPNPSWQWSCQIFYCSEMRQNKGLFARQKQEANRRAIKNNQIERAESVNLTDGCQKKRLRFNGAAEGKNEQFSVSITGDILFLQKS
jgi:hypothetical protein